MDFLMIRMRTGLIGTLLGAMVIGCGADSSTDPSPRVPGTYTLAAIDGDGMVGQPCFATVVQNGGSSPQEMPCAVRVRTFTARFDSSGSPPAMVVTAAVLKQDGDTSTWEVRIPTVLHEGALFFAYGAESSTWPAEWKFLAPEAGAFTDGMLTLRMPPVGALTLGAAVEYRRTPQTVYILTESGALPTVAPIGSSYRAISFAGQPDSVCSSDPNLAFISCSVQSLTLTRNGGTWILAHKVAWLVSGVRTDSTEYQQAGLPLVQRGSYVYVGDPWAAPVATPGGYVDTSSFAAVGSVVGAKMVLFPMYSSDPSGTIRGPIVLQAR